MKQKKNMEYRVKEEAQLLDFLLKYAQGSKTRIKSLLKHRQVLVDGVYISQFNHPLQVGQVVSISQIRAGAEALDDVNIVFEDDDIIVIEKEAGLLSIATETERTKTAYNIVKNYLKAKDPKNMLFIVHRLDKATSGIMIFAKNAKTQEKLQKDWQDIVLHRNYVAVVEGKVRKDADTIISYLKDNAAFVSYSSETEIPGSKKAISHYKVLRRSHGFSLVDVEIETGRKNQIRVHMKDLGHSIAGDKKYGAKSNPLRRLGLHARSIVFVHPSTGKTLSFQTGIPKAFMNLFSKSEK